MKKFAIFDLDGTIIDSSRGVLGGFMHACTYYGMKDCRPEDFYKYIGPPLVGSFEKLLGEGMGQAGAAKYREYYSAQGQFECTVYPGVEKMLKALHEKHCTLILATSKKSEYAENIMEYIKLKKYFDVISGSQDTGERATKTGVMRCGMRDAGITDPGEAVMVGDRMYDIDSARELGMESIGVLYGFGTEEELKEHKADYLAATPEEIENIILLK